jgi:hypothetical protein
LNSSVRRSDTFANRRNLDNIKQLLQNRPQLPRIPENGIRWFPGGGHHMARVFLPTVRASGIAVMYSVDQAVPAEQIAATANIKRDRSYRAGRDRMSVLCRYYCKSLFEVVKENS